MLLLGVMLISCAALTASQPTVCHEDANCSDDHFCDVTVYRCKECLQCQDLKREPLPFPKPCIKSIEDCGQCLKGLMENPKGELECVEPMDQSSSLAGWIAGGVIVAAVVVLLAFFVIRYILSHSDIFKFKVDTNIDATLPPVQYVAPTAPDSPPPYSPPRPTEDQPPFRPGEVVDPSHPLMKPYQPPLPAMESQDRQKVSMFNAPAYVRLPNGNNGLRPSEAFNDVNENYHPLTIQEEDTTPSPWAPGTNYNDSNGNPSADAASSPQTADSPVASGDLATALAIARNTDLIQSPPAQHRSQFVNGEEGASGDSDPCRGPQGCTRPANSNGNYNVMNVQVITTFHPRH